MNPIFDISNLPYLSPKTLKMKDPAQLAPNANIVINEISRPSLHSRLRAVNRLSYELS